MYNNVVIAIELSESPAKQVLEKAAETIGDDARVRVLHVVEPQYVQYSFDPTFTGSLIHSLEEAAKTSARRRVAELCEPFGIDEDDQHIVLGHAGGEIHKFAKKNHCDLIIMGTHGRRGWQLLLGSTARAVLHGTPVDVCMMRIQDEQ